MDNKIEKLVKKLNEARNAYYLAEEIMTDKEYDSLFDELVLLEKETGIILPDSPTQTVGATEVKSGLPKSKHEYPALSQDKVKLSEIDFTKKINELLKGKDAMLSWKLDGLTVVLTYDNGELIKAVTRGNGYVGEVITPNAKNFEGIPCKIPFTQHLIVRGEALISYSEFNRINNELTEEDGYKNPRNLASGTVRALDPNVSKERKVTFKAFGVVTDIGVNSKYEALSKLDEWGFKTVERTLSSAEKIFEYIEKYSNSIDKFDFPVDGLVLAIDDIEYSKALGSTGHHPKDSIAIKWADTTEQTTLRNIEWSLGRTGVLTPVAIFDPIELEGTTVSRASLHNISYIMDKDLRIGDDITVYKANMIIPQIDKNISGELRNAKVVGTYLYNLPSECPCCHEKTGVHNKNDILTLWCNNPFCPSRKIKQIVHMCERDCLNVVGLSEEIITKLVNNGFISNMADVFKLKTHPEIANLENFGVKSYKKLIESVEKAKNTDFVSFIHAMGIPNIGKGQAKLLKKYLDKNYDELVNKYVEKYFPDENHDCDLIALIRSMELDDFDWTTIDGFGSIIAKSLSNWITIYLLAAPETHDSTSNCEVINLLHELTFNDKKPEKTSNATLLAGKTFVITGDVHIFKNRAELQMKIEELGGKTSSSVSSKTNYLINNDIESNSSKNKKAKELGIPIISEDDFLIMIN